MGAVASAGGGGGAAVSGRSGGATASGGGTAAAFAVVARSPLSLSHKSSDARALANPQEGSIAAHRVAALRVGKNILASRNGLASALTTACPMPAKTARRVKSSYIHQPLQGPLDSDQHNYNFSAMDRLRAA